MIELYNVNGGLARVDSTEGITESMMDFLIIRFRDYKPEDIEWVKSNFNIDFALMNSVDDIEVSSHFHENERQTGFHFSLPYFDKSNAMVESSLFLIFTDERIFSFTFSGMGEFLSATYAFKFAVRRSKLQSVSDIVRFQIEIIADYYADITEGLSKKIKNLASRLLIKKDFSDDDLDIITQLNFNNLLIKESLNEFSKILIVFKRSVREPKLNIRDKIDEELSDLSVVSDYIQFNFDRLDDLKENISNKIDLEQNRIFKILTMVTVCIAIPTFIAAVYGMKFEVSPGFKWMYSYPVALGIMALSIIIAISIFKRRRWL
jgi:magnesium transporter